MSAPKDNEKKEMTPLTPGELMKLVLPMSESMYLTVKLLVKERDDWQALANSKAQELEDVLRERDKLEKERDIALSHIASLHTAFEDWKVYHSTSRLEAEHAAERYKLRQEVEHERFLREQAEAMCAHVQDQREDLRQERDELRSCLQELRIRYHAAGRRPEECYEMSMIDNALAENRKQ